MVEVEPRRERVSDALNGDGCRSNPGDSESRVGVRDTVRDCFVVDGAEVAVVPVKLNVKYLWSSKVQIEMTMFAWTW